MKTAVFYVVIVQEVERYVYDLFERRSDHWVWILFKPLINVSKVKGLTKQVSLSSWNFARINQVKIELADIINHLTNNHGK